MFPSHDLGGDGAWFYIDGKELKKSKLKKGDKIVISYDSNAHGEYSGIQSMTINGEKVEVKIKR